MLRGLKKYLINKSNVNVGKTSSEEIVSRRQYRKYIGVISASEAVGCTSMAVITATYLCHVRKKKVAVIEAGEKETFRKMAMHNDSRIINHYCHRMYGIDFFYSKVLRTTRDELKEIQVFRDYDYIILDYGKWSGNTFDECIRCDVALMLGSLQPWKQKETYDILDKINGCEKGKICTSVLMIQGAKSDIDKIKGCSKVKVLAMPHISDSTRIDENLVGFFEKII